MSAPYGATQYQYFIREYKPLAVWFGELDEPHTEGRVRVRALDPELVWFAHEHEPWRLRTV
jgi:hypothetical protein